MGSKSGFSGSSSSLSLDLRRKRLTVTSSSMRATTMSPLRTLCVLWTASRSPSKMPTSRMLSPRTRSRKSALGRNVSGGTSKVSSMFSTARMGSPAATRPTMGSPVSPTRRMPRDVPGTISMCPLRRSAFKCSSAALGDLKRSSLAMSARVGG